MASWLPARAAHWVGAELRRVPWLRRALFLSVGLLLVSAPATAEWLSLKDGNLIETKGAWKDKGKVVVYTSTLGALVSIRSSEVDLKMSVELGKRMHPMAYSDLGASVDPTDEMEAHKLEDARSDAERQKLHY